MANFKTFNSGEWAEVFVFLKLIYDKKLCGLDKNLNLLNDTIDIVSINKNSNDNKSLLEYVLSDECVILKIDGVETSCISNLQFSDLSKIVYEKIKNNSQRTFSISEVNKFLEINGNPILKAGATQKKDISINLIEPITKKCCNFGFSIKSNIKNNSTILNASKKTNIIYTVDIRPDEIKKYKGKAKRLLKSLPANVIHFDRFESDIFYQNLQLIDTQLPVIIAKLLLMYFEKKSSMIDKLLADFCKINILGLSSEKIYEIKIKEFLVSVILGMNAGMPWNKSFDADGGLIVVKSSGDIGAFYIFKEVLYHNLMDYLLSHSYFDTPSTSRHDFGYLYIEGNKVKLKLNMQIRLNSKE